MRSSKVADRIPAGASDSPGSRPPPGIAQWTPTSSLAYRNMKTAPVGSRTATLAACLGIRIASACQCRTQLSITAFMLAR